MITWIASYPKSGNTWFRLLLNGYFTGSVNINNLAYCLSDHDAYFHQSLAPKADLTQKDIALLRPAALLHTVTAVAQKPLFMKTHHANCDADGISMIPPTLTEGAIYLIRDPRDVALSNARHFNSTIDESIDILADSTRAIGNDDEPFVHYLGSWTDHVKSWTGGSMPFKVAGVRYESLCADPMTTFKTTLEKLDIEVDEDKVAQAVQMAEFSEVQAQEAKNGFAERPENCKQFFHSGQSTWRRELTEAQINKIELAHGDEMRRHGYDPVTL